MSEEPLSARKEADARIAAAGGKPSLVDQTTAFVVFGLWVTFTCVVGPLLLGSALSLNGYAQSFVTTMVSTTGVLSLVSWYGIVMAQWGRYRKSGVNAQFLKIAGSIFTVAGWLVLVVTSVVTGEASQWVGWFGVAWVFCGISVAYAVSALRPVTGESLSARGALQALFILSDRELIERSDQRLCELAGLIERAESGVKAQSS